MKMKKEILTLLILVSGLVLHAETERDGETRTATHTVDVSSGDVINVLGKNKTLIIETWNESKVEIVATVNFYGEPNDRMLEFLNDWESIVKGNIRKFPGELTIDAEIDEPNKVQVGGKYVGIRVGYSDKQFGIEYKLKVPSENPLELRTSYKSLWMTGTYADVEIDAYSTDFKGEDFEKVYFKMKYGDATIKSVKEGKMELYENDMDIKKVEYIDINDKYSEFKFEEVGEMKIQGYETDIQAGNIERMNANMKYGEMNVTNKIGLGTFVSYEYDIHADAAGNLRFDQSKYSNLELDRANQVKFFDSYEDELDVRYLNILESKAKYAEIEIDELGKSLEMMNGYENDVIIRKLNEDAESVSMDGKYLTLDILIGSRVFGLNANVKYGKISFDERKTNVRKYIKENDKLTIEAGPKGEGGSGFLIHLTGYEIKAEIE